MRSAPEGTGYPADATFDIVMTPQLTENERLTNVFNCIQENGYTLQTFLKAACLSDDEEVRRRTSTFGTKGGAIKILELWMERFPCLKNEPVFEYIAVNILSETTNKELRDLRKSGKLRSPASSVTPATIQAASLRHISELVERCAPLFHRIMRKLIGGEETDCSARLLPVISSMIMYNRSERSNYLQSIIGIHLFSSGCPSSVVTLLQRMALSTSRWTVKETLKSLTQHAIASIKLATMDEPFGLLFDNINMARRKHDQRLDNMDAFENGATATIIPNLNMGGVESDSSTCAPLTMSDIIPNKEETEHLSQVAKSHLINVLQRAFGPLPVDSVIHPVRQLIVTKTPVLPLPSMKIDQSTLEGNLSILNQVIQGVMNLPEEYFQGRDIVILGDQLTVSRVTGLKQALEKDLTRYKRLEWAVPIIQLFHTQMMFAQLILRTHYGNESVPGSLGYNKALLGRKRVTPERLIFHDVDEFLRHSFEAMVLRLWEVNMDPGDNINMKKILQNTNTDELSTFTLAKAKELVTKYLTKEGVKQQTYIADKNSALFIRDMVLYIEFAAAIKKGDVGRIEHVLRWLTIMAQAGFTSNYATELLKLQFGLKRHWSKERRETIVRSWLVNTKGEENGFIPSDLYQEHCNKTIKEIYASKGSNASWEMLADMISTNIRTFELAKSTLQREFGMPEYSSKHQSVSATKDINAILEVLRKNFMFEHNDTRSNHHEAESTEDLLSLGINHLTKGKLAGFNRNSNLL